MEGEVNDRGEKMADRHLERMTLKDGHVWIQGRCDQLGPCCKAPLFLARCAMAFVGPEASGLLIMRDDVDKHSSDH